jgi:hypothetical protein
LTGWENEPYDEMTARPDSAGRFTATPDMLLIRRALRKDRLLTARWLRLAVVVSLWHAPIPWLHIHEMEGPSVDRLALLAQHIAEFHGRDSGQPVASLDWHMHVILPWDLIHHAPCQDQERHQNSADDDYAGLSASGFALVSATTVGQPLARGFQDGQWQLPLAPESHSRGMASAALCPGQLCRQFFATYGTAVSVRDLTGLLTC